jgi:hypothetical protein
MLNVGWLEKGHEFPTGQLDAAERDALVDLAVHSENVMRGLHDCEFCDVESPIVAVRTDGRGERAFLGTGEVHLKGEESTYASPTLIIHYIDAHGYLPPPEFRNALARMAGPDDLADTAP